MFFIFSYQGKREPNKEIKFKKMNKKARAKSSNSFNPFEDSRERIPRLPKYEYCGF